MSRWEVLLAHQFDPERDLVRDWQGLWQLTDRTPALRRGCQRYFAQRNEGSVDL